MEVLLAAIYHVIHGKLYLAPAPLLPALSASLPLYLPPSLPPSSSEENFHTIYGDKVIYLMTFKL